MSGRGNSEPRRSVVLIGSGSGAFIDIVGEMVGENGFDVATPGPAEPPWLSVTRTQPSLVICDCSGLHLSAKRLIIEMVARRLPLLIVAAPHERTVAQTWPLPECVAWLEFPIAREQFRETINDLMSYRRAILRRHLTLVGAGVTIEAGITVETLDTQAPPRRLALHTRSE
jgi:hypothetical protein